MKSFLALILMLSFCLIVSTDLIYADTVNFMLGDNPMGDVNINLNGGTSGLTVQGIPIGFSGITVNFTSTQLLLEPANGQARVSANPEGTPLTNLVISLAGGLTYNDLIINPFVGGPGVCPNCVDANATISVIALSSTGTVEAPQTFMYALGNGNNFLTIFATGGERIVSTSISAPGGINDLRQPRISPPFLGVPEPASLFSLGCSLLGLVLVVGKLRRI